MAKSADSYKQYRKRIREEVLLKYGGHCACCGEDTLRFLTVNHMNNDGAAERNKLSGGHRYKIKGNPTYKFFQSLRRSPLREDLNILCWNCNAASFYSGACPHQTELSEITGLPYTMKVGTETSPSPSPSGVIR
jgi:hypothetical protein